MNNISEKVANAYRTNSKPVANPGNKVTRNRRRLFNTIQERTGGNNNAELDFALQIIRREKPRIEQYILSKNEVPNDTIEDLAIQAYNLRCREIDETVNTLGVSEGEAQIFLENDEAETEGANNYEAENFIGELFAPIGIIAKHSVDADEFVDPSLLSGLINTAATKLDSAALKRAAQNKKSGVLGFLTGGKNEYEMLRTYLQKPENEKEKQAVLAGAINSVSQLRGFQTGEVTDSQSGGVKIGGNDVIDEIARIKRREMINKYLPFIIIGLVVLIFATIYFTKYANRK